MKSHETYLNILPKTCPNRSFHKRPLPPTNSSRGLGNGCTQWFSLSRLGLGWGQGPISGPLKIGILPLEKEIHPLEKGESLLTQVVATRIFLKFSPRKLGKMNPFWRSYFSKGSVQPPTRQPISLLKIGQFRPWKPGDSPNLIKPPFLGVICQW